MFTKVEITDIDQLKTEEHKKQVYIEETFTSYFIVAFYEDGKKTPTLMIQVEKFPFSDLMHNSMEEWIKFLKILVEESPKDEIETEDDELKKAAEKRIANASTMNDTDKRLYRQVIEANGRLTDDYVDCAEFVYDILNLEGIAPPSGDCVVQFGWYKDQEFEWGTDVNSIMKGDILLWDDPDDVNNKSLNHTGFAIKDFNNGDAYIPVIHSGLSGCYCGSYTYPSYKKDDQGNIVTDSLGNQIVIYNNVAECDQKCIEENRFSVKQLNQYINSDGNTEDGDLLFRQWVRPKKK